MLVCRFLELILGADNYISSSQSMPVLFLFLFFFFFLPFFHFFLPILVLGNLVLVLYQDYVSKVTYPCMQPGLGSGCGRLMSMGPFKPRLSSRMSLLEESHLLSSTLVWSPLMGEVAALLRNTWGSFRASSGKAGC